MNGQNGSTTSRQAAQVTDDFLGLWIRHKSVLGLLDIPVTVGIAPRGCAPDGDCLVQTDWKLCAFLESSTGSVCKELFIRDRNRAYRRKQYISLQKRFGNDSVKNCF